MDAQATFSCSFTQSDLASVAEPPSLARWPAQRLLPQERQDPAVQVLAGAQPVSDLARELFPVGPFSDQGHQFVVSVPEPSTLRLGMLALVSWCAYLRFRRKRRA